MFYERTCNGKGSDAYLIEVPTALFQKREGKTYSTYRKGRNNNLAFPQTITFIEIFIGFANIILFNHDHGRIYNGDAYF